MVVFPEEARLVRRVEQNIIAILERYSFVEMLFSRIMLLEEWREVAQTLGGISEEMQSELVLIPELGNRAHALCHWQCEPYYRALQEHGNGLPPRAFDRSGWSYRNEKIVSFLRPREFLRIEAVWRGARSEVAEIMNILLVELKHLIEHEGIAVERVRQDEELRHSNQRDVVDLIGKTFDGQNVELAGGHLHGPAFIKQFWLDAPPGIETACIGVSLTRIARLLSV